MLHVAEQTWIGNSISICFARLTSKFFSRSVWKPPEPDKDDDDNALSRRDRVVWVRQILHGKKNKRMLSSDPRHAASVQQDSKPTLNFIQDRIVNQASSGR